MLSDLVYTVHGALNIRQVRLPLFGLAISLSDEHQFRSYEGKQ
jgi:hypothetical protein